MKKIITLIAITSLIACCKKKDIKPAPADPEPSVCKTADAQLKGKYYSNLVSLKGDTLEFVLLRNNCPTSNSNVYLIKDFGRIANKHLGQTAYSTTADYTVTSNEETLTASGSNAQFHLDNTPGQLKVILSVTFTPFAGGGSIKTTFVRK